MSLRHLDKPALFERILQLVEADLATATAAQRASSEGATHEEAKPENDKDTRALESSYLARGQAARVVELGESLATLVALKVRSFVDEVPIALTALVALEADGKREHYVLVPVAGGLRLSTELGLVRTTTPASPMGRALLGKCVGDEVEVRVPGGAREFVIVDVA